MVKIYFCCEEDGSSEYCDISIWSLVKANFLSSLIMFGIFWSAGLILGLFFGFA